MWISYQMKYEKQIYLIKISKKNIKFILVFNIKSIIQKK